MSKKKEVAVVEAKVEGAAVAALPQVSPEIYTRMVEAKETLESFSELKLPLIRFKEGFTLSEGEDPVEEFTGVIVYTKESNVYYKGRYKPGQTEQPDCFSADGKKPTSTHKEHTDCKTCPHNQFGSAKDGDGKACKNTRPIYLLVGDSIMPRVLRIPPTSLSQVKNYIVKLAADYGSYYGVKTKISCYKRDESQTHMNIKFEVAGRLSPQEKVDVQAIRSVWMQFMQDQQFMDVPEEASKPSAPAFDENAAPETRF